MRTLALFGVLTVLCACGETDTVRAEAKPDGTAPPSLDPREDGGLDAGEDASPPRCSVDAFCEANPPSGASFAGVWASGGATYVLDNGIDAGVWLIDGGVWTRVLVTRPPEVKLHGIWGSAPNDVWITGEKTTAAGTEPLLVHGVGTVRATSWEPLPPFDGTAEPLRRIWGSGADDFYVLATSALGHYRRGAAGWSSTRVAIDPEARLEAVFGSGPADVWIGGSSGGCPYVARGSAAGFARVAFRCLTGEIEDGEAHGRSPINSGWFADDSHGVVVDAMGNRVVFRDGVFLDASFGGARQGYSGESGLDGSLPSPSATSAWGTGANDVYTTGYNHFGGYYPGTAYSVRWANLMRWDGASASVTSLSTDGRPLVGPTTSSSTWNVPLFIGGSGPKDVWIVGGPFARHYEGPP